MTPSYFGKEKREKSGRKREKLMEAQQSCCRTHALYHQEKDVNVLQCYPRRQCLTTKSFCTSCLKGMYNVDSLVCTR